MTPLYSFLDKTRDSFKATVMRPIARALDRLSGGKISPATVTITGFFMHFLIAYLIAQGYFGYAAGLLIIFGLFDALDGELARLQNRAGPSGMFLDTMTDRMKEVALYAGIAYVFVSMGEAFHTVWVVAALGGSLLPGYVNAWGEATIAQNRPDGHKINMSFRGSLMRFEIRMLFLVIGLLSGQLITAVMLIAILGWFTTFERCLNVYRHL